MTAVSQPERLHKDKKPAVREFSPREGQRNTGFLNVLLEAAERTEHEKKTGSMCGNSGGAVYRGSRNG